MRALRERASAIFFSDFKVHPQRYVGGELPRLPFADGEFDLTVLSYLLFAYQDRFDYEFHRDSILEIMRVTRSEARIYPTVTFEAQPSEYIPILQSNPALRQFAFTEIKTDFEFLVNSNSFLRVMRGWREICRASVSDANLDPAFHRMEPAGAERHRRAGRDRASGKRASQTPYNCAPASLPKQLGLRASGRF